jgi:hypothetical protein
MIHDWSTNSPESSDCKFNQLMTKTSSYNLAPDFVQKWNKRLNGDTVVKCWRDMEGCLIIRRILKQDVSHKFNDYSCKIRTNISHA